MPKSKIGIQLDQYTLTGLATVGLNKVAQQGDVFILFSTPAAINIQLYRGGAEVGYANNVQGSARIPIEGGIDAWAAQIVGGGTGNIIAGVADKDVAFNNITGTLEVVQSGNSGLQADADVVVVANTKTQLVAANAARRSVIITSLHSNTGYARIGDINTAANKGIELQPGQSITLDTVAPVYVIDAQADTFNIVEILT